MNHQKGMSIRTPFHYTYIDIVSAAVGDAVQTSCTHQVPALHVSDVILLRNLMSYSFLCLHFHLFVLQLARQCSRQ